MPPRPDLDPAPLTSPLPASSAPVRAVRSGLAASSLMALQCLVIVGFTVFYVVEFARGQGVDRTQVEMSIVVFLLGAAGIGALAYGLRRGAWWARTPTVLWNVLLLPVAVSMAQAGQVVLAAVIGVVAAATIVAVLTSSRR